MWLLLEIEVTRKEWVLVIEHVLELVIEVVLQAYLILHCIYPSFTLLLNLHWLLLDWRIIVDDHHTALGRVNMS